MTAPQPPAPTADMSAGYVRKYILGVDMHGDIPVRNQYGASTILFTDGRMAFNNPDGSRKKGSPKFASMVVVFTSRFQQDGMYVGVISRVKEPRVKKTKVAGSGDIP